MKRQSLMEQELVIRSESQDRLLSERIDSLVASAPTVAAPTTTASIGNLIDDSDFSWSTDAYTTPGVLPSDASKPNNRAYNWYWMERATALLVDDEMHSIKSPDFPPPDADDIPRWNKIEGFAELGETGATPYDICCPLPNNFVTPGMRFYIQMLARLRTTTALPGELKFFWELWDNTNAAPLPDVIKGTAFPLSAATYGPLGATSRDYKLIVQTDYGDQIESTVATVTNGPAALTPTNGIALSWPRYPGFTQVFIYVTEGGNDFLVFVEGSGQSAFNDVGQRLGPVALVPSVAGTEPRAYAETRTFTPTLDWVEFDFSIVAPSTYNFGLTTGKQWLRGGVLGLMGDPNQLQIDRIGVSTGFGLWAISSNDKNAASLPSTTQTGSTQGPPSGNGHPPGDGDGGVRCAVLSTPYLVVDEVNSKERWVDLGVILVMLETFDDARHHMFVRGMSGHANQILHAQRSYAKTTVEVRTANGHGRRCSLTDRWFSSLEDMDGTPIAELNCGDNVMTIDGLSPIVKYCVLPGAEVGILSTDGDHTMCAGGSWQHNVKPNLEL